MLGILENHLDQKIDLKSASCEIWGPFGYQKRLLHVRVALDTTSLIDYRHQNVMFMVSYILHPF